MQVLAQSLVAEGGGSLPPECALLAPPLLQRQALLYAAAPSDQPQPPLVYACSWWNEAAFGAAMPSPGAPIWKNLATQRAEAYRDLRLLTLGEAPQALCAALQLAPGTVCWARSYVLYQRGVPLTVIYEVFSPRLGDWLGGKDGR